MRSPPSPTTEALTSRQAADRLGVKLETLYAYVARGLIRAELPGRGARGRLYSLREVEAFLARRRGRRDPQAAAAGALFWGMPVVESAVSCADGARLLYRGRDSLALAEEATFEGVAALLWTGAMPPRHEDWPSVNEGVVSEAVRAAATVGRAASLPVLQLVIAALALADEARFDTSPAGTMATGRRMIPRIVAATAAIRHGSVGDAGRGPMAARVLVALGGRPSEKGARLIDRALVLGAEHELNASTFTTRVAASTGADPYAAFGAGVAALGGPKHGGATERVETLVRQIGTPARAARAVSVRLARGEAIPGFGHPLYRDGDPRVTPLLAAVQTGAPTKKPARLRTLLAIVDAMAACGRPPPTLDVGLVATTHALGLGPGSAALLFAFARTAGWIAHILEQAEMDELIRPRARYVGQRGQPA